MRFGWLILLLAIGCQPSPSPFVMGHVASFSGSGKELADQAANGIKLALDDYAAEKPTRPIVVRHADDRGDLAAAEGQAVRLVTLNRAMMLLGGTTPAEALRLERAGAPVVSPIGLRDKSMGDLVVTTGLSPAQRGTSLATYLRETIKPAELAFVIEAGDDAKAAESAFREAWPRSATRHEIASDDDRKAWVKFSGTLAKDVLVVVFGSPTFFQSVAGEPSLAGRPLAYAGPELARQPWKSRTEPIYLVTAFAGTAADEFAKRYAGKFSKPAEPQAAIAYDDARFAIAVLKQAPLLAARWPDDWKDLKEFNGLTGAWVITQRDVRRPAFPGRLEAGSFHLNKSEAKESAK